MLDPIPYAQERWFQLLQEKAKTCGVRTTAAQLGYANHTGTVLILNGRYPGKTDKYAQRVLEAFDRHVCPHTGQEITIGNCRSVALLPAPTHNPMKRQHWQACQRCSNKPKE